MKDYFKRMHEIFNIPEPALQKYWDMAERIADKHKKEQKSYASAIFYNLVSVSEEAAEVAEDVPDWWKRLSNDEKQEYLTDHPNSKLKLTGDEDDTEDGDTEAASPKWWLKLNSTEQQEYLDNHPDSDLKVIADKQVAIKSAAKKMWQKRRAKVASTLSHHKAGLHSLKTLLSGGSINREETEQAKKTAVLATKLVLGALVGIAVFATLSPLSIIVANMFLNGSTGSSESSESSDTSDLTLAQDIADNIHDWLMKQDLQKLTEQAKEIEAKTLKKI